MLVTTGCLYYLLPLCQVTQLFNALYMCSKFSCCFFSTPSPVSSCVESQRGDIKNKTHIFSESKGIFLILWLKGPTVYFSEKNNQRWLMGTNVLLLSSHKQVKRCYFCLLSSGVWHNFMLCVLALAFLFLLPLFLLPFYSSGAGALVTEVVQVGAKIPSIFQVGSMTGFKCFVRARARRLRGQGASRWGIL